MSFEFVSSSSQSMSSKLPSAVDYFHFPRVERGVQNNRVSSPPLLVVLGLCLLLPVSDLDRFSPLSDASLMLSGLTTDGEMPEVPRTATNFLLPGCPEQDEVDLIARRVSAVHDLLRSTGLPPDQHSIVILGCSNLSV